MNVILQPQNVVKDKELIVEQIEKQVCLHPRHKTLKKGLIWKCWVCGEVRVKGVNSRSEEK